MGASKSNSSSSIAGDSGDEDLKSFAPSTPIPPSQKGGLFRMPSNTTLAVDFSTVMKRKEKEKTAVVYISSKL
jgi:hypothetical protein